MPAKGWKVGESIVGRQYGLWRVLAGSRRTDGKNRFWLCVCECGTFRECATHQVTRAARKARPGGCGCNVTVHGFPMKRIAYDSDAMFAWRYRFYRIRATTKLDVPFELSLADFAMLSRRDCHYCGAPPAMLARMGRSLPGQPLANGVDRVDSRNGYKLSNCVPCCTNCNEMKLDRSVDDFLEHVRKIVAHSVG